MNFILLILLILIIASIIGHINEKAKEAKIKSRAIEEYEEMKRKDEIEKEKERQKEKEQKIAEEKFKKDLKPMQDRLRNFLKNHPGETFSESELRKHLRITTASEDGLFSSLLYFADPGTTGHEAYRIEGVMIFSSRDGLSYAYYVDPSR